MLLKLNHKWSLTEEEARNLQAKLAKLVAEEKLPADPELIAGVDVSYNVGENILFAGVVVISRRNLKLVEKAVAVKEVKFPYIPGLLSFRETPALIEAFSKLKTEPDIILVDGQGIAHPRAFGIASHIGVLYDKPTVGVAKSILVGKPDFIPKNKGEFAFLRFNGKIVGALLCTQTGSAPVVVSVGHKVTLEESINLVNELAVHFRIPEPTRLAHIVVNEARRKGSQE